MPQVDFDPVKTPPKKKKKRKRKEKRNAKC